MKLHTEKEHIIQSQHFAYRLRDLYLKDKRTFNQLSDYIPISIHINKKENLDITYANNKLLYKGPEIELLKEKGASFLKEISCPILLQSAKYKTEQFKIRDDEDSLCSYPQQIRVNNKMIYLYSNKLHLNNELYFTISNFMDEMGSFGKLFSTIFSPLQEDQTLWLRFQSLTKQEKIILKLLGKGNSNKMVSDKLFISIHTVRTHRKSIYKKLTINNLTELINYSLALELL